MINDFYDISKLIAKEWSAHCKGEIIFANCQGLMIKTFNPFQPIKTFRNFLVDRMFLVHISTTKNLIKHLKTHVNFHASRTYPITSHYLSRILRKKSILTAHLPSFIKSPLVPSHQIYCYWSLTRQKNIWLIVNIV